MFAELFLLKMPTTLYHLNKNSCIAAIVIVHFSAPWFREQLLVKKIYFNIKIFV